MSTAGRIRVGIEGARELEIEVGDVAAVVKALEKGLDTNSIVWIEDSKGDRHGVVSGRLAFVEVESTGDRSIGFG